MSVSNRAGNGSAEQQPLLGSSHLRDVVSSEPWEDERAWVSYPASFLHITWLVLKSNYVNVFLVFVPLGILGGLLGWDPTAVFVLNFLAIVPLAALLSFATEELAAKLGQTLGGLMNATFGNAVELIVSGYGGLGGRARARSPAINRKADSYVFFPIRVGQHRRPPEGRDSHRAV